MQQQQATQRNSSCITGVCQCYLLDVGAQRAAVLEQPGVPAPRTLAWMQPWACCEVVGVALGVCTQQQVTAAPRRDCVDRDAVR